MDIYSILLNLVIGIIGGIFSSIIVSRIFFITSDYKEQLARVQTRVEIMFNLSGSFFAGQILLSKGYSLNDGYKEKFENTLHDIQKNFDSMIFDDLEPELNQIAIDLDDFVQAIRTDKLNQEYIDQLDELLPIEADKFFTYRKKYKKILRKLILKDNILRILSVIFIITIVSTVIAYLVELPTINI